MGKFKTSNPHLAAALLSIIPSCSFIRIEDPPNGSGMKDLVLEYPELQEQAVRQLISDFLDRRISVDLYRYNRALSGIRDGLGLTRRSELGRATVRGGT